MRKTPTLTYISPVTERKVGAEEEVEEQQQQQQQTPTWNYYLKLKQKVAVNRSRRN